MIWDSHPLALGATPSQVFIDGIAQLPSPYVVKKPDSFQKLPKVPNFDVEAREAVEFDGLPPLTTKKVYQDTIMFTNVRSLWQMKNGILEKTPRPLSNRDDLQNVVIHNGSILCYGYAEDCSGSALDETTMKVIDLEGGAISPGLVSFGSALGLQEIAAESSTNDGIVYDPLQANVPHLLGRESSMIHAVDGLQFGTRNAL